MKRLVKLNINGLGEAVSETVFGNITSKSVGEVTNLNGTCLLLTGEEFKKFLLPSLKKLDTTFKAEKVLDTFSDFVEIDEDSTVNTLCWIKSLLLDKNYKDEDEAIIKAALSVIFRRYQELTIDAAKDGSIVKIHFESGVKIRALYYCREFDWDKDRIVSRRTLESVRLKYEVVEDEFSRLQDSLVDLINKKGEEALEGVKAVGFSDELTAELQSLVKSLSKLKALKEFNDIWKVVKAIPAINSMRVDIGRSLTKKYEEDSLIVKNFKASSSLLGNNLRIAAACLKEKGFDINIALLAATVLWKTKEGLDFSRSLSTLLYCLPEEFTHLLCNNLGGQEVVKNIVDVFVDYIQDGQELTFVEGLALENGFIIASSKGLNGTFTVEWEGDKLMAVANTTDLVKIPEPNYDEFLIPVSTGVCFAGYDNNVPGKTFDELAEKSKKQLNRKKKWITKAFSKGQVSFLNGLVTAKDKKYLVFADESGKPIQSKYDCFGEDLGKNKSGEQLLLDTTLIPQYVCSKLLGANIKIKDVFIGDNRNRAFALLTVSLL